jgi:hypothetical protein
MLDTEEQFISYIGWFEVVESITTIPAVFHTCGWPNYLKSPYVSEEFFLHISSVST